VGVLQALAQIRREAGGVADADPFPVITGASAGAINAAALASRADDFDASVGTIVEVWQNFRADQVYRTDSFGEIRTGARWLTMLSIGWAIARWRRAGPRSVLDNAPLQALLNRLIDAPRLRTMMREGHLHAVAVSPSSTRRRVHRKRRLPEPGAAGHALSNIFLDALAVDIERLQRINTTLALLSPEARNATSLKPIEVLVIAPSQRLDDIAARTSASCRCRSVR
jgi:predicted acylesterase/phospholipase RssA